MPFYTFFGDGSPTKNRLQTKKSTLILTSLLEDLVGFPSSSRKPAKVTFLVGDVAKRAPS